MSAIVPARNEALCIAAVVQGLLAQRTAAGERLVHEVLVADNGSSDGTAAVALAAGARVITVPQPGYGQACWQAVQASVGDVLLFVDGDGAANPAEAGLVLAGVDRGAELVIGVRQRVEPGAMSVTQCLGNRLACWLMRRIWRMQAQDLGPYRAIRRDAFDALDMRDRSFGWTVEMQVRAHVLGMRVADVPVVWHARRAGVSKISGSLRGVLGAGVGILGMIARLWWQERQRPPRGPAHGRPLIPFFPTPATQQQEIAMFQKMFVHTGVAAALALAAGMALASGSDGGASAETGDAALYNIGKSVFATKLACSGCPMAGKSLDGAMARDLMANKPAVSMSAEESAALDVYLKRRFKL